MRVIGISPLDKDATVSVVEDGEVLFAASEERFSRQKQHAGFPHMALEEAMKRTGSTPEAIDKVLYAFYDADEEGRLMREVIAAGLEVQVDGRWRAELAKATPLHRDEVIPGLADANQRMTKGWLKETLYRMVGLNPLLAASANRHYSKKWLERAQEDHAHWQKELEAGLVRHGLADKLERQEHHLSHACNAYLASGYDQALILTLDGYGSGMAGSVSVGENGDVTRLKNFPFPHSLGHFYEKVTAALGYRPDRHAGKIVGLAAYGDPEVLSGALLARFQRTPGDYRSFQDFNFFFDRHLAARHPVIDVAAAYQHVLEQVVVDLTAHWVEQTGHKNVVLSGGVTANVKMNQRIFEVPGVEHIFVYPNMGDGGCGTGLALAETLAGQTRTAMTDVYLGPDYGEDEIVAALEGEGLTYERPADLAAEAARRIHDGQVVARFDGRMEYGPRALGNRSILYHGRDPSVNLWLNERLGRTEFMPFAPVTLWEARDHCYKNIGGAEHAAEFMTITFDCTDLMKAQCPAAVHVDGTARPQLIRRAVNPGYYDILKAYEALSGIPTLINTSFNMHEEPIVCTPADAARAFVNGRLDCLVIGPFIVDRTGIESDTA